MSPRLLHTLIKYCEQYGSQCQQVLHAWAGNASEESPAKTTPTAAGKQHSPGPAPPVSPEAPELDELLLERLEKNINNTEDFK